MLKQKMSVWNNTVEIRLNMKPCQAKKHRLHICNICEFSYATKEILKVHTKKHNPENDTSVINATTRETKVES